VTNPLQPLPKKPLARAATVVALVVGGAVAVLVPIFFAVMLWGMIAGQ
jgi:hypothetical protein